MSEPKRYKLESVADISELINEENFANFMIDFTDLMIKVVKIKKSIKEKTGKYPEQVLRDMTWIDDGENGTKEMVFDDGKVLKFDTFKINE